MKSLIRRVGSVPVLGRSLFAILRLTIGLRYTVRPLRPLIKWVFLSREYTNFTYELTPANEAYLASFVAATTGATRHTVLGYLDEIKANEFLRRHIEKLTKDSPERHFSDLEGKFGRRLGWYAYVRIKKPKVVVETGVEKGLGACVIAAALRQNAAEGHLGKYYGTDIQPRSGYLFRFPYSEFGQILIGDSIESLSRFPETIDLFIGDSDHSEGYEAAELECIEDKLAPDAVVLSDNAHVTQNLLDFANRTNREFLFFAEEPQNHWYPGAGIGVAFSGPPSHGQSCEQEPATTSDGVNETSSTLPGP